MLQRLLAAILPQEIFTPHPTAPDIALQHHLNTDQTNSLVALENNLSEFTRRRQIEDANIIFGAITERRSTEEIQRLLELTEAQQILLFEATNDVLTRNVNRGVRYFRGGTILGAAFGLLLAISARLEGTPLLLCCLVAFFIVPVAAFACGLAGFQIAVHNPEAFPQIPQHSLINLIEVINDSTHCLTSRE